MDLLTFVVLLGGLIAIGLSFFSMWYNHRMNNKRLKQVAMATLALKGDKSELELCKAINDIDPHACPIVDYTIETKDGEAVIQQWSAKSSQPTKDQLKKALKDLREELRHEIV